jgi:hypothetical protein
MGNYRIGKPRKVCSVVKNWVENKQNVGVVGWVNNQVSAPKPAHEWKRVCTISKRTSTKANKLLLV